MNLPPYNPFEYLSFDDDTCFLSGEPLTGSDSKFIHVFPVWLIDRYKLDTAGMMMLNGDRMKYRDMLLPASEKVKNAIDELDRITREAFESGYDAVRELSDLILFQWMARVQYGVLYQDFVQAIRDHEKKEKDLRISIHLKRKIKNLLFMLQSLIRSVEFDGFTPWTIRRYRVNISKDVLNYKDETQKLNFCLGMNGFGVIACMQDNGSVAQYHKGVLDKVGNSTLHPAQFEELYGLFIYANYLMKGFPDYLLSERGDTLVFSLPESSMDESQRFGKWNDETFAQVLANLWQPWGIPLEKIYSFPDSPISYLIDEHTFNLIRPEDVDLPY